MTEKEKAASGLMYDANYDDQLIAEREYALTVTYKYNNLNPSLIREKESLLKSFLGKTGKVITILPPFNCDYGYNLEVGENFFANYNLVVLDAARVTIGDNCFIAPNVGIYTAGHPLQVKPRNLGLEYAYPVTIGNNVWIGAGVTILPGVTIGHNVVIGAGSVVTKDIPDNVLAFGNPCRVVKEINQEE